MALAPSLNLPTHFPISSSSFSSSFYTPNFQTQQLFKILKPPRRHGQSSPISSSFLQTPARKRATKSEPEIDIENSDDPIANFVKTRTSGPDPDPGQEGRIPLKMNRRTSSHLAPTFENSNPESQMENYRVPILNQKWMGVVEKILKIARTLPENVTLGEALERHEFGWRRLGEMECLEVLRVLGEEGNVMGCFYFFEWMGMREPCLVSPKACAVLFRILGKAGKGDELLAMFKNLPFEQNEEFRDVLVYNSAIAGLMSCRRYDDAWKVYELMETSNIRPDQVTCSIMFTIMRKRGDSAKDSWEFFSKMTKEGVKWGTEAANSLVKSFCDEGLIKEALIIQSEFEKRGLSSDVIMYNTIMDAYTKSDQIKEAEALFAEMKIKRISPDVVSYTILMDAYCKRMQPEIVEKLLQEMENNGLEPDVKSYTCLISAYGRKKKMSDMAADAFLRMKKASIKPCLYSYTALIHAYSLDGWHEKAYIAFENMLREGIKPSIRTYTTLLHAFRHAGDTETLMRIWKMMVKDKVKVTPGTFNVLLDGLAKQGHYIEARDVLSESGKIGFNPDVRTYNILIKAYARGGQGSKIPQLWNEMAALDLKPNSFTYVTTIYAYIRVRDFERAFYYYNRMVKSGQLPDERSYRELRAILDLKAKLTNMKDTSADGDN